MRDWRWVVVWAALTALGVAISIGSRSTPRATVQDLARQQPRIVVPPVDLGIPSRVPSVRSAINEIEVVASDWRVAPGATTARWELTVRNGSDFFRAQGVRYLLVYFSEDGAAVRTARGQVAGELAPGATASLSLEDGPVGPEARTAYCVVLGPATGQ